MTTMPSTAHEEYLSEQGDLDWRTRVLTLESVLVEENSAMVLGVGDEACTLLYAGHMPPAIEVITWKFSVREQSVTRPAPSFARRPHATGR